MAKRIKYEKPAEQVVEQPKEKTMQESLADVCAGLDLAIAAIKDAREVFIKNKKPVIRFDHTIAQLDWLKKSSYQKI